MFEIGGYCMSQFFDFFITMWRSFFNLLSNLTFELYGYQVNFLAIVFVLFIVGFMITAFWKGSKT